MFILGVLFLIKRRMLQTLRSHSRFVRLMKMHTPPTCKHMTRDGVRESCFPFGKTSVLAGDDGAHPESQHLEGKERQKTT